MFIPIFFLSVLLPVCFSGRWSSLCGIHFLREEFAPKGANSFLKEVSPFEKGGKKSRTVSSESIHFNTVRQWLIYLLGFK